MPTIIFVSQFRDTFGFTIRSGWAEELAKLTTWTTHLDKLTTEFTAEWTTECIA